MSQSLMWLIPLIIASLGGIIRCLKADLQWSSSTLLQFLLVLVIGIYALLNKEHQTDYIVFAWCFMLSFTLIAKYFVNQTCLELNKLRTNSAMRFAKVCKFLLWGRPGKFWLDLVQMIEFYCQNNETEAKEIFNSVQKSVKILPKAINETIVSYHMLGLVLLKRWNEVCHEYYKEKEKFISDQSNLNIQDKNNSKISFPLSIALPSARALAETKQYEESIYALELADLESSKMSRFSIETLFISYFSVLGATEIVNKLINDLNSNKSIPKSAFPRHMTLYWQGRCNYEAGNLRKSSEFFAESIASTPEQDLLWKERSQKYFDFVNSKIAEAELELNSTELEVKEENEKRLLVANEAERIMNKALLVSEILSSKNRAPVTNSLLVLLSITFLASGAIMPHEPAFKELFTLSFGFGILESKLVFAGEYWRLISYQFLHANLSHLAMNLFALAWFGRFAEGLYGSSIYTIIFIGSGIIAGLAQMIFTPEQLAVGASGSILGIFGASAAGIIKLKNLLPKKIRQQELKWMLILAASQILFDQIINLIANGYKGTSENIHIASYAHVGGMIGGFLLAFILPIRKFTQDSLNRNDR